MRLLYFLGDGVYAFLFYIRKYRRDIVVENLQLAFPEKTIAERNLIEKKFYHNFVDTFIETLKLLSASDRFLNKRFKGNWEVFEKLKTQGKPIQVHLGHNFNWEWGNRASAIHFPLPFLGVYKPLENKIFDRLIRKLRNKSGTILLRSTHMREDFFPYRNIQYILGLVADQSPRGGTPSLWFRFFGRPTSFVKGPAKNAIINNANIVFAFIKKERRGYYEMEFTLATDNPRTYTEEQLTKQFVVYLENIIRTYPDMWLWSHRRWKRTWQEGEGAIIE